MTNIYLLMKLVIVSAIIVICAIQRCDGVISDKRLCFDPKCSVPVSLARTMVKYSSIEPHILSFPPNTEITIFSKEAGSRRDLWGAAVGNKRGYVPKTLVREIRKMKSNLTHEVPTEFGEQVAKTTDKPVVDVPSNSESANTPEGIVVDTDKPPKPNVEDAASKPLEFKEPEDRSPESESVDPASLVQPSDSQAEGAAGDKAEQILEGVQSVTPSFEVIDGTAIPYMAEDEQIRPSQATPIVAATASPEEGPILSILPIIPVTDRPLLARFSNSDSKPVVEDGPKTESKAAAENQTGENEAKQQADDSKVVEGDKDVDNNGVNDSKIENSGQEHESSGVTETADNNSENAEKMMNDVDSKQDNEVLTTEEPVQVSGDTSGIEAAGSSATGSQKDGENEVENIYVETETVDVVSTDGVSDVVKERGEGGEDVPEIDLNNNNVEEEPANTDINSPEIVNNSSEIEGTIREQELPNSGEQTEYLPKQNVIVTRTEADKGNENENEIGVEETVDDSPGIETRLENVDDRVIVQNEVLDEANNFDIHSVDNVVVETKFEDGSQNNSQEEILAGDSPSDNLPSLGSEEPTQVDSNFLSEALTTARSLFSFQDDLQNDDSESSIEALDIDEAVSSETQTAQERENDTYNETDVSTETPDLDSVKQSPESTSFTQYLNTHVAPQEVCDINSNCADLDNGETPPIEEQRAEEENEGSFSSAFEQHDYLKTLLCLSITAFATLLFSLGYYYIENRNRDKELVGRINELEKELLVTTKESMMLDEGLKATKHKLNSIEDESFGSNEMVLSLKAEIEAGQIAKGELEDQIVSLEKELESATEAGLELERMLREFLASQSDENPLAQSVEDLQTRLNAQQATNESLTNNLNLKSQENEALTSELASTQQRCQQLEVEVTRLSGELQTEINLRTNAETENSVKIAQLSKKVKKLAEERAGLTTQLAAKEMALNDLSEVIKQQNSENFDFDKLYAVSHIKAEAELVAAERDELKMKLTEVEGAHDLLEEHMKLIKEEIASVTEQYELAERDKTEAQTRLEVLSNYFKEKETQLQKELGMQEAMWVQKQGEVTSTVDRIQTMQNEIQNYRQQIETLKREILDQEREYKSQIVALETKSHEQWVIARQSERRLEESKAEASQLRNRLTMVEKSMNEVDPDTKLHRLETNGETASSPQLFMGAESSSSPIIFSGSSGVPPPLPPSYMFGAPLPPPFMPPPPHPSGGPMYDISRRPPPLGGRLSSPPPMPLHHPSGRYEDAGSPPPPMSPPLHPPYNHRSPPPFSNERIHPHPPPPFLPPLGTSHSWGDEPLPHMRNPVFHPHQQRDQRIRNHKGSLHSSGDSLDKTNHTGKS